MKLLTKHNRDLISKPTVVGKNKLMTEASGAKIRAGSK